VSIREYLLGEENVSIVSKYCWLVVLPNGDEIVCDNLKKFCEDNDLNCNYMYNVNKGILLEHNGYWCHRIY